MDSKTATYSSITPPTTGFFSVRAAAYLAQLLVTLTLSLLIRHHLLSEETADLVKNSPEAQMGLQLLADGIMLGFIGIQGWVTKHFMHISGEIAKKKIEIIGAHQTAIINAESGTPPPLQSELKITTTEESK